MESYGWFVSIPGCVYLESIPLPVLRLIARIVIITVINTSTIVTATTINPQFSSKYHVHRMHEISRKTGYEVSIKKFDWQVREKSTAAREQVSRFL